MEHTGWYEHWFSSLYYKILYQDRDELEAQEFIGTLLHYLQPLPGSPMLDIACGEGRFAIELAQRGFDVTGIDISHQSIEKAKAHENERLHFAVHDMRFPSYINYFDYAFNFFTSFGYFIYERDHQMAAKSFAAALRRNGILVIDYLNREYVLNKMVPEETVQRGSYTFRINKKLEQDHITKTISFTDADNKPQCYTESVAAFSLSDFIRIFKRAGLSLISTFGNYRLDAYDPLTSPRMIMVFKK